MNFGSCHRQHEAAHWDVKIDRGFVLTMSRTFSSAWRQLKLYVNTNYASLLNSSTMGVHSLENLKILDDVTSDRAYQVKIQLSSYIQIWSILKYLPCMTMDFLILSVKCSEYHHENNQFFNSNVTLGIPKAIMIRHVIIMLSRKRGKNRPSMHFIKNKCFSRNSLFERPWYICITVLIICQFDNKHKECSDSISVAFNASSDDIISFETHFECVNRFQCKYFDVNASIALDYLSFCVNDFATTLSKWIESVGIGIGLK